MTVTATVALGAGHEGAFDLCLYSALTLVLTSVGVLILRRHPRHRVGLLFCGLAGWLSLTELGDAYGIRARTDDLPAGEVGEWLLSWSWIVELSIWPIVFLVFPDGRLPGPRWRPVVALLVGGGALASAGYAVTTEEQAVNFSSGRNPLGIEGPLPLLLFDVGIVAVMAGALASVAAMAVRYRRTRGHERQQLKWLAVAAAMLFTALPLAIALWHETYVVQVLMGLALMALPAAAGVAILRHRLYDVDLVINRALVYGLLTAALAATYLMTVLVAQLALPALSDLGVAVSTLAAAMAFRPARVRIQASVDRRFFRARYDAARTLAAFGARLREDVSIEALDGELRAAVDTTLRPAHISLWMRP